MHSRSLNQLKRPYGRELNRRYKAGDENIFWKKNDIFYELVNILADQFYIKIFKSTQ